jgi:RecB family exonuclease
LKREVIYAIKSTKNGKAAGSDNIPAETLKFDPSKAADMLRPLFQGFWQRERFPKEWKEGIAIKIPKKRYLSLCNNW